MKRKQQSLVLMLAMLMTTPIAAQDIVINGVSKDVDSMIVKDTTVVSVRELTDLFKVALTYNGVTKDVTIQGDKTIVVSTITSKATIDGENMQDVVCTVKNGTTYLPLRFICENLGIEIGFSNGSVTVQSDKIPTPKQETFYKASGFKIPTQDAFTAYEAEQGYVVITKNGLKVDLQKTPKLHHNNIISLFLDDGRAGGDIEKQKVELQRILEPKLSKSAMNRIMELANKKTHIDAVVPRTEFIDGEYKVLVVSRMGNPVLIELYYKK